MSARLSALLSQPKLTHNLLQGTEAWHGFRLGHRGASEAAAMLGLSTKVKRTELLHAKHTGIAREFSDWLQKNVLDRGHQLEAAARPHVEKIIGDDLYPVTCSRGLLSASCDGLTMDDETAFEHKQWNEELAAAVSEGVLPDEHWPQCQQILLVTGAKRVVFTVSDGTPDKLVYVEVFPDVGLWEQLVAGWDQFDADLAAYVPTEVKEMPKPEVSIGLPALFIHAKGEITTSNMKEYGEALAKRLAEVRAIALVTDQDFSNAKASAKLLREQIEQAKLAKAAMLAQTVTVGEAALLIDAWCEDMRLTALQLEKDVEREDKAKKEAMVAKAKAEYLAHIQSVDIDLSPGRLAIAAPNFAEAIKNKRSYASMQDAVDTMLATAKSAANTMADLVRHNREQLRPQGGVAGEDWIGLFPDFAQVCTKSADDFHNLVSARVAAERQRQDNERARIRAEEEQRAATKLRLEQEAREAEERRVRESQTTTAAAGDQRSDHDRANDEAASRLHEELGTTSNVRPLPTRAPAPQAAPTLKLGDINARLKNISITEAGLAALGFPVVATERGAKLYHDADWPAICDAIVDLVTDVRDQQKAAA